MERRTGLDTVQAAVRVGASFIDTADCASVPSRCLPACLPARASLHTTCLPSPLLLARLTVDYENAPAYGSTTNSQGGSETVIGLALKEDPEVDAEAFVTTKASRTPFTEEQIRTTCSASMTALQMETIPLYQLHRYDTETPIAEQMGTLKALQDEGKIMYIGTFLAYSASPRTVVTRSHNVVAQHS